MISRSKYTRKIDQNMTSPEFLIWAIRLSCPMAQSQYSLIASSNLLIPIFPTSTKKKQVNKKNQFAMRPDQLSVVKKLTYFALTLKWHRIYWVQRHTCEWRSFSEKCRTNCKSKLNGFRTVSLLRFLPLEENCVNRLTGMINIDWKIGLLK